MLQAFMMVLREGFESFLIVAVILSYLQKSGRKHLSIAVYAAVLVSIAASFGFGYVLMIGVNEALWEGVLGLVTIAMVGSLVIHMWRHAHQMKANIAHKLDNLTERPKLASYALVFLFSSILIVREGMETALMLLQVRDGDVILGIFAGLGGAGIVAWLWIRCSHLINVQRFFRVTGVFLLLFMVQVAIYSFHEFSEAGLIPNSEAIHEATEAFSPTGRYGQWFPLAMVLPCLAWLLGSLIMERERRALRH